MIEVNKIITGDTLEVLKTWPDNFIDCCITSPPYWGLRDYGAVGQLGLEKTPEEYVGKMVDVFREVKRVLKKEGTCWLNLGDSYCGTGSKGDLTDPKYAEGRNGQKVALNNKIEGLKQKDLVGIPWRVAFALQADGWYLRQDIIWAKPNPMPESVTDRCTKSHEYVFLLAKSPKYYFDNEAIKEPATYALNSGDNRPPGIVRDRMYGYDSKEAVLRGRTVTETKNGITIRHPNGKHGDYQQSPKTLVENRNKRSVWTITTKPFKEAHFATFPEDLVRPMILAGCPKDGTVLDIFMGAGTTGLVAKKLGRNYLGIELNDKYVAIANKRINSIPELML
jgi:DNA modification methylase